MGQKIKINDRMVEQMSELVESGDFAARVDQ